MSTFVYESPNSEVRIVVEADSEDQAYAKMLDRILALAEMRIYVTDDRFQLISAY